MRDKESLDVLEDYFRCRKNRSNQLWQIERFRAGKDRQHLSAFINEYLSEKGNYDMIRAMSRRST